MSRRAVCWAVALVLVAGCGESTPPSPRQLVGMGRFDEAIEAGTQSLRANPRDAEAYLYRGRAYHCRNADGDLARAVADFTASIDLAPKESEAYYSRALAYRDQGLADKSAADVRLARQFDPRLQEIYAELPSAALFSTAEKEGTSATADEKSNAEDASESEPENGTRTQAERREAQKKAVSSATTQAIAPFDVKPTVGAKTKQQILESVRKQEQAQALTWEDEFLSDEELLNEQQVAPPGKTGTPSHPRSGQRSRVDADRITDGPSSPFRPRLPSMSGPGVQTPAQRPVQSPFPQRAPRPTGFVDEPLGTGRAPGRTLYDNPYSVPTVRPPGAYHDDFRP